jgi:hypothetical protein
LGNLALLFSALSTNNVMDQDGVGLVQSLATAYYQKIAHVHN